MQLSFGVRPVKQNLQTAEVYPVQGSLICGNIRNDIADATNPVSRDL
jgi:hypothetical protein